MLAVDLLACLILMKLGNLLATDPANRMLTALRLQKEITNTNYTIWR